MGKPWEEYKEEIYELYIRQNLPLKEVQERLKREYQFDACKRAFQNQIEAWGFRKNVRSSEMQVYVQQKKLRKSDSEIDLPDETKKIITPRKARRFEKRSESMNAHKSATALELDPAAAAASAMGVVGHHHHQQTHHHHHHPSLQSPQYPPQHRMSMGGQGFSNFNYPQETVGYSPTFAPNPSGHDMPKYAQGMTISLCDDANHGSFSIPACTKSPYSPAYVNPAMTSAGFSQMIPAEAPLYDLTDDFSFQTGMPYLPKKNDWYERNPISGVFTCEQNFDSELLSLTYSGAYDDVKLMLEKGANPNAVSFEGDTALTALFKGVIQTLHQPNYPPQYLFRYLKSYNNVLEMLLARGADPNAPSRAQEFPLQLAYSAKEVSNQLVMSEDTRKQVYSLIRHLNSYLQARRGGYSY